MEWCGIYIKIWESGSEIVTECCQLQLSCRSGLVAAPLALPPVGRCRLWATGQAGARKQRSGQGAKPVQACAVLGPACP